MYYLKKIGAIALFGFAAVTTANAAVITSKDGDVCKLGGNVCYLADMSSDHSAQCLAG